MGDPSNPRSKEPSSRKLLKPEEVPSVITGDTLMLLRKKYFFPDDLVVRVPAASERVCRPPAGYVAAYEMSFQAGLRFPLPPELTEVLKVCEICSSQLSCRSLTIIIGLIVFFRRCKAVLSLEALSRILRLTSDSQGRVSCRCKWLDLRIKDPAKNWSSRFFFVKNEWGLREKWGSLKDLPPPLHLGDDDLLKLVGMPNPEELQFELRYIHSFVSEESLFVAGLSMQAGRSHAVKLKQTSKEKTESSRKVVAKRPIPACPEDIQAPKRQKAGTPPISSKAPLVVNSSPDCSAKNQIPEDVQSHSCTGLQRASELLARRTSIDLELEESLKEWNAEFVRVKYFQGECKRRCSVHKKRIEELEDQLSGCRSELAALHTSYTSRSQEADRARDEVVDALSEVTHLKRCQKILESKVRVLELENTRLSGLMTEQEIATDIRAVEDFKNSLDFRTIIQERIQQERDRILDVEVKELERQCREEGFLRGFLKTSRLVHRQTGADIEGLSPSQVSEDPPSDAGEEVDSVTESDEIDVV